MSQESDKEKKVDALYVRLESAGVLTAYKSLLDKYSMVGAVRADIESVLNEYAPLSKKYHQGLIDVQRTHRVSPDFIQELGTLLGGVKTKTVAKKKKTTSKKKDTSLRKRSGPEQFPVKVTAEVAGPTKEGLVLKVVVPWSEILSNIPPNLLNSIVDGSSCGNVESKEAAPAQSESSPLPSKKSNLSKSNLSKDELFRRYQAAVMNPSPESAWEQILFFVTGSDKVSLDQLAAKVGSDKETIRKFLQTEYEDIQQYVEIRLEGDHVSASHK
jgi:hypothetical protein